MKRKGCFLIIFGIFFIIAKTDSFSDKFFTPQEGIATVDLQGHVEKIINKFFIVKNFHENFFANRVKTYFYASRAYTK